MKRILNALLFPLVRFYWFVFRPETHGVKCVIECGGEILMLRNSYGRMQWTFPGGGIDAGETPEEAVKREVREEVGIKLESVRRIGQFFSELEYKKDTVTVFVGQSPDKHFVIDPKEILEARWFYLDNLPKISEYAKKILSMWRGK